MQGTPETVDIDEIAEELEKIDAIKNIHHVHIWELDEHTLFFEAHVNLQNDILVSELSDVYGKSEQVLKGHFGVTHLTIQFEYNCCLLRAGYSIKNKQQQNQWKGCLSDVGGE